MIRSFTLSIAAALLIAVTGAHGQDAPPPQAAPTTQTAEDILAAPDTTGMTAAPAEEPADGAAETDDPAALATAVAELTTPETLDELGYIEVDPRSADGQRVIREVSGYLNSLDTLQGRFLQVSYNGGSASGDFFLDRPGKARFAYDPPHPSLIVSNGRTVAHQDRELETVDRVPLRATPLHLFLKSRVDLARDTEVLAIVMGPGEVVLTAHDPDGEMEGEVAFVFTAPSLELREWIVVDALDQQVRVILSDIRHGAELDPALFVLRDDDRGRRSRR